MEQLPTLPWHRSLFKSLQGRGAAGWLQLTGSLQEGRMPAAVFVAALRQRVGVPSSLAGLVKDCSCGKQLNRVDPTGRLGPEHMWGFHLRGCDEINSLYTCHQAVIKSYVTIFRMAGFTVLTGKACSAYAEIAKAQGPWAPQAVPDLITMNWDRGSAFFDVGITTLHKGNSVPTKREVERMTSTKQKHYGLTKEKVVHRRPGARLVVED